MNKIFVVIANNSDEDDPVNLFAYSSLEDANESILSLQESDNRIKDAFPELFECYVEMTLDTTATRVGMKDYAAQGLKLSEIRNNIRADNALYKKNLTDAQIAIAQNLGLTDIDLATIHFPVYSPNYECPVYYVNELVLK